MGVMSLAAAARTKASGKPTGAPLGVDQLVKICTIATRRPNWANNPAAGFPEAADPGTNTPNATPPPPPGPGRPATALLATPGDDFEPDERRTTTKPPMASAATRTAATNRTARRRVPRV